MAADRTSEEPGDTTVLRRRVGPLWRFWVWVAQQWSALSLGTLAVVIVGGGGWLVSLKTRVTVLEHDIVPDLEMQRAVAWHETRITRLEDAYRWAQTWKPGMVPTPDQATAPPPPTDSHQVPLDGHPKAPR